MNKKTTNTIYIYILCGFGYKQTISESEKMIFVQDSNLCFKKKKIPLIWPSFWIIWITSHASPEFDGESSFMSLLAMESYFLASSFFYVFKIGNIFLTIYNYALNYIYCLRNRTIYLLCRIADQKEHKLKSETRCGRLSFCKKLSFQIGHFLIFDTYQNNFWIKHI